MIKHLWNIYDDKALLCKFETLSSLLCSLVCMHCITNKLLIYIANEPAFQYEGGLRLVNGLYSSDGILEVFKFATWYTLCTDELPSEAANAVCTQLGYTQSVGTGYRFA